MSLMICAPGAYAGKGYWTADDTLFQQICVHITYLSMGLIPFVVRTAQTIKIMELTHDGLELCLGWGERSDHEVCHNITVTPSAFNATYDTGFFVLPSANQSDLGMDLHTKYQHV